MKVPASICELAHQLPDPANDYLGACAFVGGLPRHVLIFHRRPRTDVGPDFHYRFLWVIALKGAGNVVMDGMAFPLQAGQRILVPPFVEHGYTQRDSEAPLECIFIGFEMSDLASVERITGVVQECRQKDWEILQSLIFSSLNRGAHGKKTVHAQDHRSGEIVIQLLRMLEGALAVCAMDDPLTCTAEHPPASLVERVWVYARDASPAPITGEDGSLQLPEGVAASAITRHFLAAHLAVSESTLRDFIKRASGFAPREFVRRIRLHRAAVWLLEYGFPVHVVARNAGYAEASSFSNEFKKMMGRRPSELSAKHEALVMNRPVKRPLHAKPPFQF